MLCSIFHLDQLSYSKLNIKTLRNQPEHMIAALVRRGFPFDLNQFNQLEKQRKSLQLEVETLQAQRNQKSKATGQAKAP